MARRALLALGVCLWACTYDFDPQESGVYPCASDAQCAAGFFCSADGYCVDEEPPGGGGALRLQFRERPSAAVAGEDFVLEVALLDGRGRVRTGATDFVGLGVAGPEGGRLLSRTGSPYVFGGNASAGIFRITAYLGKVGTYTIHASAAGYTGTSTGSFVVTPGAKERLRFTVQPRGSTPTQLLSTVQVAIQDAFGNTLSLDGEDITVGLTTTAVLLGGTATVATVGGVASFTDLSVGTVGNGYRLAAVAAGVSGAQSQPFAILVPPDVASVGVASGTLSGCVGIDYVVSQPAGQRVDVLVEIDDGSGTFVRATQAPADPGPGAPSGVSGVTSSDAGIQHTFSWASDRDIPLATSTARLRLSAAIDGLSGDPALIGDLTIDNTAAVPCAPSFAGPRASLLTFFGTQDLAVGDVNADGKPDAVVPGPADSFATLLLGRGDGSFVASTIETEYGPTSVVLAQLDENDRLDLVTAVAGPGLSVQLQDGSGSFAAPVHLATPSLGNPSTSVRADDVTVADLDADGKNDILALGRDPWGGGTVYLYMQESTPGTFAAPTFLSAGETTDSLHVAELTGDAHLDVAYTNPEGGIIHLFAGNGDGSFATPTAAVELPGMGYPLGLGALTSGDVDGDGLADLVFVERGWADSRIALAFQDPAVPGTFLAPITVHLSPGSTTATTPTPMLDSPRLADLDGDGRLDIVAASFVDVAVVRQDPGSLTGFPPARRFGVGSSVGSLDLTDVDGDGRLDVVAAPDVPFDRTLQNAVTVLRGAGGLEHVGAASLRDGNGELADAAVGDLDGEGVADVVAVSSDRPEVHVLLQGAARSFASADFTAGVAGHGAVTLGDFDANGSLDVAVTALDGAHVSVLLQEAAAAGTFAPSTETTAGAGLTDLVAGDFNGDGADDLAGVLPGTSEVAVLPSNGSGLFIGRSELSTPQGPVALAVGDINQDGKPDLVVAARQAGSVAVLLNQTSGALSFAAAASFAVGSEPVALALADLDEDGAPEVVVAHVGTSDVYVLPNTTASGSLTAAFDTPRLVPSVAGAVGIGAGDLDADGDLDLVVSSVARFAESGFESCYVSAHRQTTQSPLAFRRGEDFGVGRNHGGLVVHDLDGDGRRDVLTAAGTSLGVLYGY